MACRLKSAKPVSNPMLKFRSFFKISKFLLKKIHSKMSSAVGCGPFCLSAKEIRYQYLYSLQKLGIYIRLGIHIKQRGAVTITTLRHRKLPQWHGATRDHIAVTPAALFPNVRYLGVTLITIRHEHVGPGHDLIMDLNSCCDCAVFMFMGTRK